MVTGHDPTVLPSGQSQRQRRTPEVCPAQPHQRGPKPLQGAHPPEGPQARLRIRSKCLQNSIRIDKDILVLQLFVNLCDKTESRFDNCFKLPNLRWRAGQDLGVLPCRDLLLSRTGQPQLLCASACSGKSGMRSSKDRKDLRSCFIF